MAAVTECQPSPEECGNGLGAEQSLADTHAATPKKRAHLRWAIGVAMIVLVALIWSFSSVLVQAIFKQFDFQRPFFLTYVANSLFVVLLPIRAASSACLRCAQRRGWHKGRVARSLISLTSLLGGEDKGVGAATDDTSHRHGNFYAASRASLLVCPIWFLANYTYNASLGLTSVTSSTVLASSSSAFTLVLSLWLLREAFAWHKLLGVLLCWIGNVFTVLQDNEGHSSPAGDALCILSALLYAVYTVAIRFLEPSDVSLFFGLLGLFNALLLAPIVLVLHLSGVEDLTPLTMEIFGLLAFKGMVDNVLSDYLWAQAVLLTSPAVATVGLSLTIPIAMLSEICLPHAWLIDASFPTALSAAGALLVVAGFVIINKGDGESGLNYASCVRCCGCCVRSECDSPLLT